MAISLNNHETRIKALEVATRQFVTLFSTQTNFNGNRSFTLSQTVNNFDFLIIRLNIWDSSKGAIDFLVSTDALLKIGAKFTDLYGMPAMEEGYTITVSGTTITFTAKVFDAASNGTLYGIYGLKLYYSFSYNIIYKILRSKISRLCQEFTLLKRKECEIIWL